ncbi:hypothetical protein F4778DRAFT_781005 [Xylariomycetidae sp. FL2044]|nr:hypothetical protein F4778DRAFT_781005 [Xylariomycetidae sp. FL2044]
MTALFSTYYSTSGPYPSLSLNGTVASLAAAAAAEPVTTQGRNEYARVLPHLWLTLTMADEVDEELLADVPRDRMHASKKLRSIDGDAPITMNFRRWDYA